MTFSRYVDDIRIFCHSRDEAIASLHFLTVVLREKELNLQTAKSYILNAEEARKEIDGISETVDKIEEEIKEELRNELEFQTDYATPSAIENYLDSIDKEVKLESIRRAFTDFFLTDNSLFDKTLFHYCINRLGAANDDFAIEFCLKCIVDRPEEFIHILPYFSKLESKKVYLAEKMIAHFINESQTLGRQYFLLLRWVYSERISSEKIVELCRELAFRTDLDNYTRHYAWAILGEFGDLADLDSIEAEYTKASSELAKSTIICSIKRMVEDRRNAIYSRAEADGLLVKYAISTTKKKSQ